MERRVSTESGYDMMMCAEFLPGATAGRGVDVYTVGNWTCADGNILETG